MVKPRRYAGASGFSMVELLVAMAFTLILMAGMATVFKASLSSFFTSGEILATARRNRLSIELLGDDLNTAEMYLANLTLAPAVDPSTPPFFILPGMPVAGAGDKDPKVASEIYFLLDQPLSFDGKLQGTPPGDPAAVKVLTGAPPTVDDNTFTVDCRNEIYASLVKKGQVFIFKDFWETGYIQSDPVSKGNGVITVIAGPDPVASVTGAGMAGGPFKFKHLGDSGVVFMQPYQMVRYRLQMVQLDPDPNKTAGIPCLVREQGLYSAAGFVADPARPLEIITENVSGFKVYLSVDAGRTWAGLGYPDSKTGFTDGWDLGIRADLDKQLTSSGRPGYTDTRGSEHWFRNIPTIVRVDLTTRSATQRAEYSPNRDVLAYRDFTQSLVFVPRHSGLKMN